MKLGSKEGGKPSEEERMEGSIFREGRTDVRKEGRKDG